MFVEGLSKDMEKKIAEYQSLQSQLQFIQYQKQQYKLQITDADVALRELENAAGDVYKNAGLIMIKSSKDDAKKDLLEKKELINVRMTSLTKQEEQVHHKLEDLKGVLEAELKKKL